MNAEPKTPVAGLLFLNICMYAVVLGIGSWAVNDAIHHGFVIYPGTKIPAHFSPIYFQIGNPASGFFVMFALLAGVVGISAAIVGLNNFRPRYAAYSFSASFSAAAFAWVLTLLAMGFACKEIKLQKRNGRLMTMEALVIILSATQFLFLAVIRQVTPENQNSTKK